MATVTGMTAEAMQAISDGSVISGLVDGNGDLKLQTRGGGVINAGHVRGEDGIEGPQGPPGLSTRPSLHSNPSFEGSWPQQGISAGGTTAFPEGWTPYWFGAGVVADRVSALTDGEYALRVSRDDDIGNPIGRVHQTAAFPVNPGSQVNFEILAKSNTGWQNDVVIEVYTGNTPSAANLFASDPTSKMQSRTVFAQAGYVTKLNVGFVMPPDASWARWSFYPTAVSGFQYDVTFDDSGSSMLLLPQKNLYVGEASSGWTLPSTASTWLYGSTSTSAWTSFVAPPSGMVDVRGTAYVKPPADGNLVLVAPQVRTGATFGSGTEVWAPSATKAVGNANVQIVRPGFSEIVTDLIPGATYHARLAAYQTAASAGTLNNSRIQVLDI